MSDDSVNVGPAITDQPSVTADNQPDPLANLQGAIDAAAQTPITLKDEFKQVFDEAASQQSTEPSLQSKEDPKMTFVQDVENALKKLKEAQANSNG